MYVYSLTDDTGKRKNHGRMMVVATVEVRRHVVIQSALGLLLGLLIGAPLMLFFGPPGVLFGPLIGIPAVLWLFENQQRKGLQVTNFRKIMNMRQRLNGVFLINGKPMSTPQLVLHQPAVIDVDDSGPSALEQLDDGWLTAPAAEAPAPVIGARNESATTNGVSASALLG